MEKEQIDELKKAFEDIVGQPPFNGQVTHRTRAAFISKWKEHLEAKKIKGYAYVDELVKLMGKKPC